MSRADYFHGGPKSDSPVGPLNALAGRLAQNVRTNQTSIQAAELYLRKKCKSPADIAYCLWILRQHLKRTESTPQSARQLIEGEPSPCS